MDMPFKAGDRVYQRYNPENAGTVTKVNPHNFRVTYDSHGRRSGIARWRSWYPWEVAHLFKPGNPPKGGEE